ACSDLHEPRNHDMRGDKAMSADSRVMADVIAAPKDDIVADLNERLNHIILKDETMFAHFDIAPNKGARADIRGGSVALLPCSRVQAGAQPIQLCVDEGSEKMMS